MRIGFFTAAEDGGDGRRTAEFDMKGNLGILVGLGKRRRKLYFHFFIIYIKKKGSYNRCSVNTWSSGGENNVRYGL